jgi:hypothetical protein
MKSILLYQKSNLEDFEIKKTLILYDFLVSYCYKLVLQIIVFGIILV